MLGPYFGQKRTPLSESSSSEAYATFVYRAPTTTADGATRLQ